MTMDHQAAIKLTDKNEQLAQTKSLMEREKWSEAISILSPYYQAGSLSTDEIHILAQCYSRNKEYDKAIQLYEDLCQKHPYEAKYYYFLAYQYRSKGDSQKAITAYEKCLELSPRWLKAALELGQLYEETGSVEKAIKIYRDGIHAYQAMKSDRQRDLAPIYSKLCTYLAKLLWSESNETEVNLAEVEQLFRESVASDPQNPDNWYRLGNFLLDMDKPDDAIQYLQKAESLAPKKEYISHKIAQAYLKKGDAERALAIYESIPKHKRAPYILHGMAECLIKKGDKRTGALYLYQATQREPDKFYHHRDLGFALASLGDRDQAIIELEKANQLFRKDHGKDYVKILTKIEEIKKMPQGEKIIFNESVSPVTTISDGTVIKYNANRGFGFIKDDTDGKEIFFHITRVKNQIKPPIGTRVKFARELGEKGPQASKVWIMKE